MTKLLNRSLTRLIIYAAFVVVISIPVYYIVISWLWQYELDEHNIVLTDAAGREDSYLIILAVTSFTVLFFILLLGGFIFLNRRISRQIWQPFYGSLEKIKKFDLNRQQRIAFEATDITEFDELNESLDRLISGNIAAYQQQKEFTDNASHELQTPLAIVQSKLDLLLQSSPLTSEQYNMIGDAHRALARVGRINKNLLLLTKIENSQFTDHDTINLSNELKIAISTFADFIEDKELTVKTDIIPCLKVDGNRILIEILLNNLLNNAIRHSASQSPITIWLSQKSLTISNKGESTLINDRLFKRFGTASAHTPGTGLGLALVKQICDRYGWQIHYRFEQAFHTFSVLF